MAVQHPRSAHRGRNGALTADVPPATEAVRSPGLIALYEQLLALRLDLVHGVIPRAERVTLTCGDLAYLLVQHDRAITATRGLVAVGGPVPAREGRGARLDAGH